MHHQCTSALVRAKKLPCCLVLLCKLGSQHACASANTPMDICCSYRCAVKHHQCTAALVKAKKLPCISLLQTSLTACFCHCKYTYGPVWTTVRFKSSTTLVAKLAWFCQCLQQRLAGPGLPRSVGASDAAPDTLTSQLLVGTPCRSYRTRTRSNTAMAYTHRAVCLAPLSSHTGWS